MKNDDQPSWDTGHLTPTLKLKLSGTMHAWTPTLCLSHWWLDGLSSCVVEAIDCSVCYVHHILISLRCCNILYSFLLCFQDFSVLFFFPFLMRLKDQQAVTAPWALTDHSPQSGCQRCRPGSATSHRGALLPVSRVRAVGWWAAHCETAPSSAQCLLHYCMLFASTQLMWGAIEET